ncbi:MAG: Fe-S cluster assembly protein SufD [Xanthomonadales bacterium]|jgi:Fe-S cluster assembly protein SufD|nr:Fe-S cluster assembly protein SufD [Xanthomonadales bacterium]
MSALLDSFAQQYTALPEPLRAAGGLAESRSKALAAALQDGLPAVRAERWRYTPLRALAQRSFRAATGASVDAAMLAHIPAPRLVFVNGWCDRSLSDLNGLAEGVRVESLGRVLHQAHPRDVAWLGRTFAEADETFARLNAALAVEGAVIQLEENVQQTAPLHLVSIGATEAADAAWHLRHLIELRHGAALTVVEHQLAADAHAHFDNTLCHVHLKPGAVLRHVRQQTASEHATLLYRTDAVLAAGAEYRRVDLELGAALSRHELNASLQGEAAAVVSGGAMLADAKRVLDTRLQLDHVARDTRCDLRWRGLASARGKLSFYGGIHIRPGADGTDAQLSNRNLLLSDTAEVNTQPVLVIDADEVKAAHGATVGQLDAQALFYLQSRGIPHDEARAMLMQAFLIEVLEVLEDTGIAESLIPVLQSQLARKPSA